MRFKVVCYRQIIFDLLTSRLRIIIFHTYTIHKNMIILTKVKTCNSSGCGPQILPSHKKLVCWDRMESNFICDCWPKPRGGAWSLPTRNCLFKLRQHMGNFYGSTVLYKKSLEYFLNGSEIPAILQVLGNFWWPRRYLCWKSRTTILFVRIDLSIGYI